MKSGCHNLLQELEAKAGRDEQPAWGDPDRRGTIWETMTALAFVMAGGDLVVVRHPKTLKSLKSALGDLV